MGKLAPKKVIGVVSVGQVRKERSRVSNVYPLGFTIHDNPSIEDFSSRLNCLLLRGIPLMRVFH